MLRTACLVALSVALLACKGRAGDACKGANECSDGLFCPMDVCVTKDKLKEVCAASRPCATVGTCSPSPDGAFCRVDGDADCRQTINCRVSGACSAQAFRCVAATDQDCAASDQCLAAGRCTLRGSDCVATEESCKKLDSCKTAGDCSAKPDGSCGVLSDKDCRASEGAARIGHLHARDGACVASGEDCRGTTLCLEEGRCSATSGTCEVDTDVDCTASEACASQRKCAAVGASCNDRGLDCKSSPACTHHGRCSEADGACVASDDAQCKASDICKAKGQCTLVRREDGSGGQCAKDCSDARLCTVEGLCSHTDKGCAALSDDDCAKSAACRKLAHCTARDGKCVGGPDACQKTEDCASLGLCSANPPDSKTECGARTDADCKKSATCASLGRCQAKQGICVVSDEGCRATMDCKTAGRCSAIGSVCAATAEDCRSSDVCRGVRCHVEAGQCIPD